MTVARIVLIAVLGLSSTVHAFTVTKTTNFNPGTFWTSFTYTYVVTTGPLDGPYDDLHISFGDISQISGGRRPVPRRHQERRCSRRWPRADFRRHRLSPSTPSSIRRL